MSSIFGISDLPVVTIGQVIRPDGGVSVPSPVSREIVGFPGYNLRAGHGDTFVSRKNLKNISNPLVINDGKLGNMIKYFSKIK